MQFKTKILPNPVVPPVTVNEHPLINSELSFLEIELSLHFLYAPSNPAFLNALCKVRMFSSGVADSALRPLSKTCIDIKNQRMWNMYEWEYNTCLISALRSLDSL